MTLLTCLALFGLCFSLMRSSNLSIEQTPFFVISIVIVTLYGFAYAGCLDFGVYLILIAGSAGLLYFGFQLYANTQEVMKTCYTSGFVVWLLAYAVVACFASTYQFSSWDEFSHWGQLSKNMFDYAGFQHVGDTIVHQAYPPGGRLLHYLFFCFSGFSEGRAYVAQMLLLMSPLSLLLKGFSWKDWHKPVLIILLALLLMILNQTAILTKATILMDAPASMFFGMGLVFYYQQDKKQQAILWLMPVVFSLLLFKSQLFPLALLMMSVMFVDILIKKQYKAFISLAFLFCAALLAHCSWAHFLSVTQVSSDWNLHLTLSTLLASFSEAATQHEKLTICNYFTQFNFYYPVIAVLALLAGAFAFTLKNARDIVSWLCANAILILGFFAYGFGLLLMYIYVFPESRGEGLDSFSRYISVYLLGWSLFVLYGGVRTLSQYKHKLFRLTQYALLFAAFAGLIAISLARHRHNERAVHSHRAKELLRSELKNISDSVKFFVPPGSKVFLVWQNSEGMEAAMLTYELHPLKVNTIRTSFGPRYSDGFAWALDLTPQEFEDGLADYDYLLLARPDDQFFDIYGGLLPDTVNSLEPLLSYTVCLGEGYSPVRADGCVLTKQQSYMFKIMKEGDRVKLMNVN